MSDYTKEEILKLIEENEAAAELMSIPRAVEQVERGEAARLDTLELQAEVGQ